jgi:DivIVA domain-containing protein
VHKKTFTPVRLREGYDMGEVDQFLDDVESELTRLIEENDDLRTKTPSPAAAPESGADGEPAADSRATSVPELPVVRTVPEASGAAARLLEIATQNADQLVTEAKEEADRILEGARAESERMESEARTRAERLDSETNERRTELLGKLDQDKENLAQELEDLRAFEREYRSRLRAYFEDQINALDGKAGDDVPLTPAHDGETPGRLQELLGEEQAKQQQG